MLLYIFGQEATEKRSGRYLRVLAFMANSMLRKFSTDWRKWATTKKWRYHTKMCQRHYVEQRCWNIISQRSTGE
jgi:hypothetical protein